MREIIIDLLSFNSLKKMFILKLLIENVIVKLCLQNIIIVNDDINGKLKIICL